MKRKKKASLICRETKQEKQQRCQYSPLVVTELESKSQGKERELLTLSTSMSLATLDGFTNLFPASKRPVNRNLKEERRGPRAGSGYVESKKN